LVSAQALILGLIGLAFLVRESRTTLRLVALCFLAMAVVCEHRSVWAALTVAVLALVLFAPRLRGRLLGVGMLSAVVLLVLYSAGTLDPLIAKFQAAFHSRGTYTDRQLAWHTLVGQQNHKGITTILVGQPFGTGFARREPDGTIETFAPHNWYVLLYLRIGLIGVGALALALARGFWRNVRLRQPVAVAWAAGLLTYCYAYNLTMYLAPLLAVALGVSSSSATAWGGQRPEREPAELTTSEVVTI
jgi:O-antigen ligase